MRSDKGGKHQRSIMLCRYGDCAVDTAEGPMSIVVTVRQHRSGDSERANFCGYEHARLWLTQRMARSAGFEAIERTP